MAFEGEDARRWSMVDAPTLQPAVDFVTKSPNGPFLDTGINVIPEMRGRVYLSVDTIREMAEIAGLLVLVRVFTFILGVFHEKRFISMAGFSRKLS
jgi:hypothetical protein